MTDNKLNLDNLSPEDKKKLLAKLLKNKNKNPQLFPTSFAQQRLWFLQQLEPESTAYNIPAVLLLTGDLDTDALSQSINEIIDRHEILRTVFVTVDNEPKQKITAKINIDLPIVDLCNYALDEQEVKVKNIIKQETKQTYNLERDSLLRTQLLHLDSNKYILLFTLHHIITDYYSMRVLMKELATIYQAKLNNKPSPLSKLELQYVDFSVWQRKWLQSDNLTTQLSYWQNQLADANTLLDLPTDYPRPNRQTFKGATRTFSLPQELSEALQKLSRKEEATLFMTLLAGFQTLLYRYTEQSDILVGSTVANRDKKEINNLIGLFVNNLIFRTQFDSKLTFKQLLAQVRETALSAYEHQDLPYEYLVEKLQPERNLSHNPLFQVMFVLHNTASAKLELPNLNINYLPIDNQTARFDLSLDMDETELGLIGSFEYNTDLFKAETIDRLISHFEILLSEVTANPKQLVTEIDYLTAVEKEQLLDNHNLVNYSQNHLVHELIEQQILIMGRGERPFTPTKKIALITNTELLTYTELNQRVNQLAHHLKYLGVYRDSLVGILLDRDSDLIISLLAVLKTGAAYVPLDPTYPAERINYIIDHAGISFLITKDDIEFQTLDNKLSVINLDRERNNIKNQSVENLNIDIQPQDLAYVIYTSGSTGKPKGVAVQHNSLLNFLYSMQEQPGITEKDTLLAVTTISFDIAALEIYLPLITGATLVLASRETAIDADKLSEVIAEYNITVMQATPATWRMLIDNNWQVKQDFKILCGGEALQESLATKLASQCQEIWNLYGPTETTIWSSIYKYSEGNSSTVSIGKPIANTQFYVLDSQLNLVPPGIPGELYIGGAGLARGYLNRPDLTAEKFISNPFVETLQATSLHQSRLYKTGDRVKQLPNGNLEYLGRLDNQVKIRGFRIELGEIEAVLNQHPDIQMGVVIPHNKNLIAYVVLDSSSALKELRQFLANKLPSYMIPGLIIPLESFPLTPNGKINRKALPIPDNVEISNGDEQIGYEGERLFAPTEEILLGIWTKILDFDQIGINSNFFELGGHSLLVTRVVSQIRTIFSLELPLRILFEHPTIRDLAQVIDRQQKNKTSLLSTIEIISREGKLPLSFAQQRQWFLYQLEPDNPAYNISTAVKIAGILDIQRLQDCLNTLVKHQEILQTAFLTIEGKPQLKINPDTVINLELIDLTVLSDANRQIKIQQLKAEDAQQPFALDKSPLMRVKLLLADTAEQILLLSIHHIIADGWSMGVLVKDIVGLYFDPPALSRTPLTKGGWGESIQYLDYAAWQRKWLQGEVLDKQLDYWQQKLQNAPAISLFPTDYPRKIASVATAGIYHFKIDRDITKNLKQISRNNQSTLFMTVLAALYLLLHRYTGNDDLVIGTPIANRNHGEVENLIGFFANTLALRENLANNPSFTDLLTQVRENTLAAYAHQDLPFEQLIDKLELKRALSYSPLFQIFLVWETQSKQKLEIEDLTWESLPRDTVPIAKFDITLFLTETTEGIKGAIEYNTALYHPDTIDRLTKHFHNLLTSIVNNPTQSLSKIVFLDSAERKQLLEEFNQTKADFPQDVCLQQVFERQVKLTPDAIALVYQQEQLTYAELNNRADELASYLQSLGVQAESKIGVMCDRSVDMIVALLAILKAGGCYIPLDPKYPQKRLDWILEDSQLNILLTQTKYTENFATDNLTIINLDSPSAPSAHLHPCTSASENLAYIIYTSGSTGKPKGVAVQHKSLLNFLYSMREQPGITEADSLLAITTISFDIAALEIYLPLITGATLVLASDEITIDPDKLSQNIAEHNITIMQATPVTWQMLVTNKWLGNKQLKILCGGEALSQNLATNLTPLCKEIWNLYGPTETTIWSGVYKLEPDNNLELNTVPIGKPIANTQFYILDSQSNLLPSGVPGELHIGGAGLARGYLNRPDLTAEKFIPNPFVETLHATSLRKSSQLYKTGDLAQYLPNGNIEYLGRIDNLVKIRGFRIELGEIETVLVDHPNVETAVVIARKQHLVAYIIPIISESNSRVNSTITTKLKTHLKTQLPDYMIPNAFVVLDEFPLTPNGKIDKKSLPDPEFTREEISTELISASTELESKLVKIWQELLGIKEIGIKDNFFSLGGDSILAIQVIAKAAQVGLQLTPKNIFQYQTIVELAAVAKVEHKTKAEQGIITGVVPLTPIQHWFFEQDLLDPHHCHQSVWLEAKEPLKSDLLEQAIAYLFKHHDALRISFQKTELGWQQTNQDIDINTPLISVDLSQYSEDKQELEKLKIANQLQSSFDLEKASLIKIALFKLGSEQADRLLIIAHHLIIDEFSWRIILEDLQTIYQQLKQEEEILLPPKTTSWKQWSEQLQEFDFTPELDYWVQQKNQYCRDVPWNVPTITTIAKSKTTTIALTQTETHQLLKEVSSAYQTQINDILLTALIQTWQELYDSNSLLIELEGYGRENIIDNIDISRTVGQLTSIYPLALNLDNNKIEDNIKSIKEQIRAIPNHGIGYGILRYLNKQSELKNFPQAEIRFNSLEQIDKLFLEDALFDIIGKSAKEMRSLGDKRTCAIEITSFIINNQLKLKWICSISNYSQAEIEVTTQTYLLKLRNIIKHCLSQNTGSYTPSDFAQMNFSQDELDDILDDI